MVSIPKVVGLVSCGFLLCLGLSNVAQAGDAAADVMNEGGPTKEGKTIKGEVLRVEGDNFFVTGQDGKEVRLYIDQTIQKTGDIQQGDQIEVMVNDQNQALSLRSPDRRNEHHDHTPDSALEAGQTGSKGQ